MDKIEKFKRFSHKLTESFENGNDFQTQQSDVKIVSEALNELESLKNENRRLKSNQSELIGTNFHLNEKQGCA